MEAIYEDGGGQEQIIRPPAPNDLVTMVPKLVRYLGLDPFELALWLYYCSSRGGSASVADMAEETNMAPSTAWERRASLVAKGLLEYGLDERGRAVVQAVDLWGANFAWAEDGSPRNGRAWYENYLANGAVMPRRARKRVRAQAGETTHEGIRPMQGALLFVLGWDGKLGTNWQRVAKAAAELVAAGYTPEQIKAAFGAEKGSWWAGNWRAKDGTRPTLSHVTTLIKEAMSARAASAAQASGFSIGVLASVSAPVEPD